MQNEEKIYLVLWFSIESSSIKLIEGIFFSVQMSEGEPETHSSGEGKDGKYSVVPDQ